MPLTEDEQRQLQEIERALYEDDRRAAVPGVGGGQLAERVPW